MTQPDLLSPHYRENQRLGVADLETEQAYRIATRRRHDVTAHSAGIAHGLTLASDVTGCRIAAGLAVDGLGRTVVVPDPVLLPWSDLPAGVAALDLFLGYREDEVDGDRIVEGADVHVTPVQPGDSVAGPAGTVYLGRLMTGMGHKYVPAFRPVAFGTAEGAAVTAATGEAVRLAHDPVLTVDLPDPAGKPASRLAVSRTAGTAVNGSVVAQDARLAADRPLLRFGTAVPAPKAAWPWRWYRAAVLADGVQTGQELRFELGTPGSDELPDWFRFAVATPDGVLPLTVDAGGGTTVGSLVVLGTLVFGPLSPDPADPRLAATLIGTWAGAVGQSSLAVDREFSGDLFDTSALTVAVAVQTPGSPATPVPQSARKAEATAPPTSLDYTVTVTSVVNEPTTDLTVAAVTTINGVRSSERLATRPLLAPHAVFQVHHTLSLPAAESLTVHVELVALGLLPGGKVTLGLTSFDWRSVPPVPIPIVSPKTGRFHWR